MYSQSSFATDCGSSCRHTAHHPRRVLFIQRSSCSPTGPRHAREIACSAADYNQRLQQARADDLEFSRLLTGPADMEQGRARSASDAGVLRRKGRLKEQDQFIDFIVSMHKTHSCEEVMMKVQRWVQARTHSSQYRSLPVTPYPCLCVRRTRPLSVTACIMNFLELWQYTRRTCTRPLCI